MIVSLINKKKIIFLLLHHLLKDSLFEIKTNKKNLWLKKIKAYLFDKTLFKIIKHHNEIFVIALFVLDHPLSENK